MRTITSSLLMFVCTGCYEIGIQNSDCPEPSVTTLSSKDGGNDILEDGNNGPGNDYKDSDSVGNGKEESHLNGDRLKRRGFEGGDGSYQFAGWYDDTLQANCDFKQTGESELHCLENAPVSAYPWNYADAACVIRVMEGHMGIDGANITQSSKVLYPAGITVYENFEIIEPIATPSALYTLTDEGECVNTGLNPAWGSIQYMYIQPIDPSVYVSAVEVID
jgi:hypothetical protein